MSSRLPPPASPDVVYVVDLSGYVFRAYHALGGLTSPSGEPTNATFGTASMLERLLRERRPALAALAVDVGRDTFRKALYPEYKAHRPPAPEDLKIQLSRVSELIDAFRFPVFRGEGLEADDWVAAVVGAARKHGLRVVIVSADKDLMQLVGDDVVLWDTMRDKVWGVPEVEERFGVPVARVRDVLALMGDSSDNIPGVPHVGPKTAAELLKQFGTLEELYAHLDQVEKKKLRENLELHREQALMSQRLVTLDGSRADSVSLEALRYPGRDVPRLAALYRLLGFQRLLAGLDTEAGGTAVKGGAPASVAEAAGAPGTPAAATPAGAAGAGAAAPAEGAGAAAGARPWEPPVVELVTDAAGLDALGARALAAEALALHVVTAPPVRGVAPLLGLAVTTSAAPRAWWVPLGEPRLGAVAFTPADVQRALGPALGEPSGAAAAAAPRARLVHDGKEAAVALADAGITFAGATFDTLLAAYLLDPEADTSLTALASRELSVVLQDEASLRARTKGKRVALAEVAPEELGRWAGTLCCAVHALGERLRARLADEALTRLMDDVELPLSRLLARMERHGVLVDTARLQGLGERVQRELALLEQRAQEVAGRAFNVHSPRQLETLLFDELGLAPLKRTKTARSTDADTLEALVDQHPLPGVVLEIRQLAKLQGTYIETLPHLVDPKSGRLRTRWGQAVAATGRLSSTDPNLQNIPIRTDLGRAIRAAFVAPSGSRLVSADYSQIELRVLAHLSQDAVLLESFRTGEDVHQRTAMEIFEVDAAGVTPELRRRAKAVNFGVIYGQGEGGLARSLGIPRAEASSFIAAYFRRYQGVRRFMNETLDRARESEQVHTLLGRRRLVPEIRHPNRARRLAAERIVMNTPIQGTAADLLKLAMLALAEPPTPGAAMVLTVHDELVFEVPVAEVAAAKARIRAAMEGVMQLAVPLVVDVADGASWSEAH